MKRLLLFSYFLIAVFPSTTIATDDLALDEKAPVKTRDDLRTYTFTVPAPRGMILDRNGEVLAQNRWVNRVGISLASVKDATDGAAAMDALQAQVDALPAELREKVSYTKRDLEAHWKNRRFLPFPITSGISDDSVLNIDIQKSPALQLLPQIERFYPNQKSAAHIIGYLSREMPDQHGEVVPSEPMWPESSGAFGIEESLDEVLAGTPGEMQVVYSENGALVSRDWIEAPVPGLSVVTTLNLDLQKLAEKKLADGGRPGAITALDALSGDIVVMASHPSFDPNEFIPAISQERFKELSEDPSLPFMARAWTASYPPGSTFKPFVALAGLDRGVINGYGTRFEGSPALEIDGRVFRNWSDQDEGMLDVRGALMRSSNTWFYRAGIMTGGNEIVSTARSFGFATNIDLPLNGVSAGNLPDPPPPSRQGIANLSIGQGEVETTTLQLATAISGIANQEYVPQPRLVAQYQTYGDESAVTKDFVNRRSTYLSSRKDSLRFVREGMWLVVNHDRGTAGKAKLDWPQVFGKTGTAQWMKGGEERNLAWFCGFVDAKAPQLAFTVMVEGKSGESLYGGTGAAPIIGEFLSTAYSDPGKYRLSVPQRTRVRPLQTTPQIQQNQLTQNGTPGAPPVSSAEILQQARQISSEAILQEQQQSEEVRLVRPMPTNESQTATPVQSMPPQLTESNLQRPAPQTQPLNTRPAVPPPATQTPVYPQQRIQVEPPEKRGLLKRIGRLFD